MTPSVRCKYAAGSDATDVRVVDPAGSLLAENGFTETATQGQRAFDATETLLRFGVASKTELRLTGIWRP